MRMDLYGSALSSPTQYRICSRGSDQCGSEGFSIDWISSRKGVFESFGYSETVSAVLALLTTHADTGNVCRLMVLLLSRPRRTLSSTRRTSQSCAQYFVLEAINVARAPPGRLTLLTRVMQMISSFSVKQLKKPAASCCGCARWKVCSTPIKRAMYPNGRKSLVEKPSLERRELKNRALLHQIELPARKENTGELRPCSRPLRAMPITLPWSTRKRDSAAAEIVARLKRQYGYTVKPWQFRHSIASCSSSRQPVEKAPREVWWQPAKPCRTRDSETDQQRKDERKSRSAGVDARFSIARSALPVEQVPSPENAETQRSAALGSGFYSGLF